LNDRVGGFFCNTIRDGTCTVCTGPAAGSLCSQCRIARKQYGTDLADLVVPLAYAKGRLNPPHQSEHHVYRYKRKPPAPRCAQDLQLMMLVAAILHARCLDSVVKPWSAVTFVPSADRPGPAHPCVDLARQVAAQRPEASHVLLDIGPEYAEEPSRVPRCRRFVLDEQHAAAVAGRHVLVVDDTWVSGDKSQSAALALKRAGASAVTVLCAARWLRNDWEDHQAFIQTLNEPYDARRCPVTGGRCPN
jgi:hypothetical protein